jgi:beta-mannosidase
MKVLALNGSWSLTRLKTGERYSGRVPGVVHAALEQAGVIEPLYDRDNCLKARWIEEEPWEYTREFSVSQAMLAQEHLRLRCEGLDTLCEVLLNGVSIAQTQNMYRLWEWPVKSALRQGSNQLVLRFEPVAPYVARRYAENPLKDWISPSRWVTPHFAYVRKAPYQFGWDWSPSVASCGPWKPVSLVAFSGPDLGHSRISQRREGSDFDLTVETEVFGEEKSGQSLHVRVELFEDEQVRSEVTAPVSQGKARCALRIPSPRLWWSHGLGEQALYGVRVSLLQGKTVLRQQRRRVGFREIDLVQKPDAWGESFYFTVNGVPVFAKGGNWVPADAMPHQVTRPKVFRLLKEVAAQHINMLRVWGGGLYESDDFYDACDELGILVWQDFMFACSAYPSDPDFLEEVRAEAVDNVRRLHHHASLAHWCGNNELEEGLVTDGKPQHMTVAQYDRLFCELLPSVVTEHSPGTSYTRSSGFAPGPTRNPENTYRLDGGDSHVWWPLYGFEKAYQAMQKSRGPGLTPEQVHDYEVQAAFTIYHGLNDDEQRAIIPRFGSEYGKRSFPVMKTIRSFARPEDQHALSWVMEVHQQGPNIDLLRLVAERFPLPRAFEPLCTMTQIAQGEHIRRLVESYRRHEKCMGFLFWAINDAWPSVEWGTVDYFGRRKASFYQFKRFYSPVMVSILDSLPKKTAELHLVNDWPRSVTGDLEWAITDSKGLTVGSGSSPVIAPPCSRQLVTTLALNSFMDLSHGHHQNNAHDRILWVRLTSQGQPLYENHCLLGSYRRFEPQKPQFTMRFEVVDGKTLSIELSADQLALWVHLVLDPDRYTFDDNFFGLRPGDRKRVLISSHGALRPEQIERQIQIRSFIDLR